MTRNDQAPALDTLAEAKIASATHDFITAHLPDWLKRASAGQINRLRDSFKAHQQSQERVRSVTRRLIPLQTFAQLHMQRLVEDLPGAPMLDSLQWLEIRRQFSVPQGITLPVDELIERREPAVLRLMQNFEEDATFYLGTGLVETGGSVPLAADPAALVRACRQLDAGGLYQRLLDQVFTHTTCEILAQDKRAGLALATEVAALRGDISVHQQRALMSVANPGTITSLQLQGYPGMLSVLGHALSDALLVQLRDASGSDQGLMLYLPSEPTRALRHFASTAHMTAHLVGALRQADYRNYFSQLVGVNERVAFLDTLGKRLADPQPDLELQGTAHAGDLFVQLVARQVQRVRDDARVLLVPTAQVDQRASEQRRERWRTAGLALANLAGLFIPGVGALLLGQFVVQTLADVFEGAADWFHGHQHEALEHMLGVAENLAVTVAVGAGVNLVARGFVASDFVEGLEPVAVAGPGARLWANDLATYAAVPEHPQLAADGLYHSEGQRWWRMGDRYYPLQRPEAEGPWRLRHPLRPGGYAPRLEFNGERGWRLYDSRPLEVAEPQVLLDGLWPQQPPLDAAHTTQVLQAAGADGEVLRGLHVENRAVPVNLHDTLERFQADARIDRFFTTLKAGTIPLDDMPLLRWCRAQSSVPPMGEAMREYLLDQAPAMRARLFEHLCHSEPADDPLLSVVRRDFPGLPELYARTLASDVGAVERGLALSEGKLPLRCLQQGASLLRLARLNRAVCGLYLHSAYCDETGALILGLLPRLHAWPALKLELWSDLQGGHRLDRLGHQPETSTVLKLARSNDYFQLREETADGARTLIASSADPFEALLALLTPEQYTGLGIDGREPAALLRKLVIDQLPAAHDEIERVLGWPQQGRWFNPGHRMADGRVGYPLSGRLPRRRSPQSILRDRLRNLYPGLDDGAINVQLAHLLAAPGSAYDALLELEDDFAQLEQHLDRWTGFEFEPGRQAVRQQVAERLRRAWRLQAEPLGGAGEGQRLSLINLNVTTLPELPAHIDFTQVRELIVRDLPITDVPTDFLRCFSNLQTLNLSNNRLLRVPIGIAHLVELRTLRLGHNNIRLDLGALDAMNGLPRLRHLDLSYNALGAYHMRYGQFPHLVELNLRHCQLGEWPSGLELCDGLERVDLRDNQLGVVPNEILAMPHVYRRGFLVERNRMGLVDMQRLYALDTIEEHFHFPEPRRVPDPAATRQHWLAMADQATRESRQALWDTLAAMPDSQGLFNLLGRLEDTGDFQGASAYLAERVWSLLEALNSNVGLRQRVYSLARLPLSCGNSVADRLSELQLRVVVDAAERNTLPERGNALLLLGQGLFRLDRLELYARQDIMQRLAARDRVDQIAVSLFYRVRLRQRLGLPCQALTMRYADAANVTDAQLEAAFQAVRAAQTPETLARSLGQRLFWERYIEGRHPQPFAALEALVAERRALLQAQQGQLQAIEYQHHLDNLDIERGAERQMLVLELTRQLLLGRERGQG
ncbi:NEL-type E3 ubiquitin ligase domain-containing protein [Pseudomonas sp. NPDC090592]|uniref:NEL-type E3 ubiquitin ligase domain-containing protein n=1 Tax=Pseudomonas sp. NPDC090592 TaxID=3364480 RepID=UPI00383B7FEF